MRLGSRTLTSLLAVLTVLASTLVGTGLVGTGLPARAEEPPPTTLTLAGEPAHADQAVPLQVDLVQSGDEAPVAGAQVVVERRTDGAWATLGPVVTDEAGHAEVEATLARRKEDNVFRASYAGDPGHAPAETGPVQVALQRRDSRVRLTGPDSVVDEDRVSLQVRWTAGDGTPVSGPVAVYRRKAGGAWKHVLDVATDDRGQATFSARPRTDTQWRATAPRLDWVRAGRSPVHAVDNLPPGRPVALPGRAPRPRVHVPTQPHAKGAGAHVVTTRIPAAVWRQMVGRTWHPGCPVGRASLRLVRMNYWDFRGYRRRGELVANADAAGRIAGALAEMYDDRLPIRSMYREDRFGWSQRVHGADDFRSMAAGNTSVFNCREVVNRPGVRSPHAWGRALDLNTWENPYRSARGIVPDTWWQSHSHPRVAWRSSRHQVVQIMARHGLRWTYGLGDTQHFDAPAGNGRYAARPAGCRGVCE
ncbi:M15 family metallopeptidase [Nocardioides panaciterrulae]|uniref:Peptidase M15C domain-containing protein n=1 Tax=Nocardioides panaciterrulae TaxID=661492 RepID=A0A7Y9E857_9ACTN|nr:M15 family metallopeptidase [Nocardioides panaciterrulae]NYD42732.1 hypothetical protein [Nocardioides panaciterrulae]